MNPPSCPLAKYQGAKYQGISVNWALNPRRRPGSLHPTDLAPCPWSQASALDASSGSSALPTRSPRLHLPNTRLQLSNGKKRQWRGAHKVTTRIKPTKVQTLACVCVCNTHTCTLLQTHTCTHKTRHALMYTYSHVYARTHR